MTQKKNAVKKTGNKQPATKGAAKKSAKPVPKAAVKKIAKPVVKAAAKKPAKPAPKVAAKKLSKPAPKAVVKKPAKPAPKATEKKPVKPVAKAVAARSAKPTESRKENRVNKDIEKDTASKAASVAKKPAKLMSAKDLEYFKKKLLAEKIRVLEEVGEIQGTNLKQTASDQSGELSHYSLHLGDSAALSYDREFSMGLAERQQKYLEQIDEALFRIEEGVYGICKVTGELISRERLEEVPVAKYSVKGKEVLERQKRAAAGSS